MRANPLVQRVNNKTIAVKPTGQVIALRQRNPWQEASASQREVAVARLDICNAIIEMEERGFSTNKAIETLLNKAEISALNTYLQAALKTAAKNNRPYPKRNALFEWRRVVKLGGGKVELLEEHKGKVLKETPAWWGPALEYYNAPSKPEMSVVHRLLTEVDKHACTYEQVRGYLSSVPAMLGRNSPARIGKNLYRLTEKQYIRRCTDNALPGDVYVADGYCADILLANPRDGHWPWRPELTCSIDLRSRVPVGWRADEHEGTVAVQNMWAEAFARWNHVPLFLYVDNGSGHKNKLMSDEMTGFYARHNITVIHAIPGNPHGKGWIERFFVEVKRDFLKVWRPAFYCGDDMSDEARAQTAKDVKSGKLIPPTLAEFTDAFNAWIARYANRPHPENKHVSKASLWAELAPLPPVSSEIEMKRQSVVLTVQRASITQGKRVYKHPDLHAYNKQKVVLEYDLMDDHIAIIRTDDGRWICDAVLVNAIDVIAPNRLEEKREERVVGQQKRIQKKLDELNARAGLVIDVDSVVDNAQTLMQPVTPELPNPTPSADFSLDDFLNN